MKRLMRQSTECAPSRVWEIPKGRKKHSGEHDMDCAIREFYEETGIPRNKYHITHGTYNVSYLENGIRYDVTYFIAITSRVITHKISASSMIQLDELCDMKWVSGADMPAYISRDVAGHRRVIHYAKRQLINNN
jgi:8-oxo-dGTP pyrophosphatase MutT (NUDIX family)